MVQSYAIPWARRHTIYHKSCLHTHSFPSQTRLYRLLALRIDTAGQGPRRNAEPQAESAGASASADVDVQGGSS